MGYKSSIKPNKDKKPRRRFHQYFTPEAREVMITRRQNGQTLQTIAQDFDTYPSIVYNTIRRYQCTKSTENKPKSGRPRITSKVDDRNIVRQFNEDPYRTPRTVLSNLQLNVSVDTIRRRARNRGLMARVPVKKPYISPVNKRRRLALARERINYPMWYWKRIIWSDEKKFELLSSKKRLVVYRPIGQRYRLKYIRPTMKFGGGSVMVWGCMSYNGTGAIVEVKGNMDQFQYRDLLIDNLQYSADLVGIGDRYHFQQDLARIHTAPALRYYFADNDITVIKWSPQSPDLNVIENAWEYLDRNVPITARTSKTRFLEALRKTWDQIPQDYCKHLVKSVPRRLQAVIHAKGGPTRY